MDEAEARILALYEAGHSTRAVGAIVGRSKDHVLRVLRRHRYRRTYREAERLRAGCHPAAITAVQQEQMRALYAAGHSMRAVAQAVGCDLATVSRHLKGHARTVSEAVRQHWQHRRLKGEAGD